MQNSLAEKAYLELKEAINRLELLPGHALREEDLARALRTSRTPIREALRRLHAEGLVIIEPGRGAAVGNVSVRELLDGYEVRELLEPFAALRAARNGLEGEDLARLKKRLARLPDEPGTSQDFAERRDIDRDLHNSIATATGNRILVRIVIDLQAQTMRVHMFLGARGRFQEAKAEHLSILDAIERKDGEGAAKRMREHLHRSKQRLLER